MTLNSSNYDSEYCVSFNKKLIFEKEFEIFLETIFYKYSFNKEIIDNEDFENLVYPLPGKLIRRGFKKATW